MMSWKSTLSYTDWSLKTCLGLFIPIYILQARNCWTVPKTGRLILDAYNHTVLRRPILCDHYMSWQSKLLYCILNTTNRVDPWY